MYKSYGSPYKSASWRSPGNLIKRFPSRLVSPSNLAGNSPPPPSFPFVVSSLHVRYYVLQSMTPLRYFFGFIYDNNRRVKTIGKIQVWVRKNNSFHLWSTFYKTCYPFYDCDQFIRLLNFIIFFSLMISARLCFWLFTFWIVYRRK